MREATSLDNPKAQTIPSKNMANVQSFELSIRPPEEAWATYPCVRKERPAGASTELFRSKERPREEPHAVPSGVLTPPLTPRRTVEYGARSAGGSPFETAIRQGGSPMTDKERLKYAF